MSRLLRSSSYSPTSTSRKKTDSVTNFGQHWKGLLIVLLLLLSAYSIYTVGVKVGMQQYAHQSSLLLSQATSLQISSSPLDTATTNSNAATTTATDTGGDQSSSLPHNLRQSPHHIQQNPLGIPQGQAQALPSIRVEQEEDGAVDTAREKSHAKYGGKGDKQHLGGFTEYDRLGVSPATWRHMITNMGIKSVMDVGCGKGVSTLYFLEHGVDVLCLEGSHDAVEQTLLPDPTTQVVEHDFSRGPYWPAKTYDAVWSVEFLEHVGRNFQYNYIQAFRKAALIFVTHSRWGGWHHVEVHTDDWWLNKFEMFGFHYSDPLTRQIREVAVNEMHIAKAAQDKPENLGPNGEYWNAQHVWLTMLVFVNPTVASLPEHAHLMAEPGCYQGRTKEDKIITRDCKADQKESELPDSYSPLKLSPEQQTAWFTKVKERIDNAKQ